MQRTCYKLGVTEATDTFQKSMYHWNKTTLLAVLSPAILFMVICYITGGNGLSEV